MYRLAIFLIAISFSSSNCATLYSQNQAKCEPLIKKWTLWDGGLAATLKIPVLKDITSWNVEVKFNKEFSKLSFFNALADTDKGSKYQLSNEEWSGKKKAGDVIAFSLLGDYVDDNPSEAILIKKVSLNDEVYCNEE